MQNGLHFDVYQSYVCINFVELIEVKKKNSKTRKVLKIF